MRGDEFKVGKLLIVNALSILRNKMSLAKWKIRGIYNRKRKFCEFSQKSTCTSSFYNTSKRKRDGLFISNQDG